MVDKLCTDTQFQLKLIRSAVGKENELVETLQNKNPANLYYKIFGTYDILEVSVLDELEDAIRINSDYRILNINTITAFCFNSQRKTFVNSIKNSVCSSLILIKLQDCIFNKRGIRGISSIAKNFMLPDFEAYPLIGFGYYEILVWLPSDNFEDIFKYLSLIRSKKIKECIHSCFEKDKQKSQIIDSITIPCVSYNKIITPGDFHLLKGNIKPVMKVKCSPGNEGFLSKKVSGKCYDLLGQNDIMISWPNKIELSEYIKTLLDFRKENTENTIFDTITNIISTELIADKSSDSTEIPLTDPPIPAIYEQIEELGKIEGVKHFLLSEVINTVGVINAHIGNKTFGESGFDILRSLFVYLNGLINSYAKNAEGDDKQAMAIVENLLYTYIKCLRAKITQQYSNKGYTDTYDALSAPPYSGSLFKILKAMSLIPEQLFYIISKSKRPRKLEDKKESALDPFIVNSYNEYAYPWQGFLFLDVTEGYRIFQQGEIIAAPYKDIFNFINWITLSHEVAHAYYVRIEFEVLESEYLNKLSARMQNFQTDRKKEEYKSLRDDMIFELFAHWFDYKHFFNGDFEFYIWSIWRTFNDIPRVHKYKVEYWVRCLFVYISHRWDDINVVITPMLNNFNNNEEFKKNISNYFLELLEKLYNDTISLFDGSNFYVTLTSDDKNEIVEKIFHYFDLAKKFEADYVNEDIIKSVNKTYPRLQKDIEKIYRGEIVSTVIKNPFLLLREILRSQYKERKSNKKVGDNIMISFIFSFWENQRRYNNNY